MKRIVFPEQGIEMNGTAGRLSTFVRNGCANLNRHYHACLTDKPCAVPAGKPCRANQRASRTLAGSTGFGSMPGQVW